MINNFFLMNRKGLEGLTLSLFLIFSFGLVSAETFGYNYLTEGEGLAPTITNLSVSEYWNTTDLGLLNAVSQISAGDIADDGTYVKIIGDTLAGNIAMGDNDISGVDDLTFTDGNSIFYDMTVQNVPSKAAVETISGVWAHTAAVSSSFRLSTTNEVLINSVSTGDFQILGDVNKRQQIYTNGFGTAYFDLKTTNNGIIPSFVFQSKDTQYGILIDHSAGSGASLSNFSNLYHSKVGKGYLSINADTAVTHTNALNIMGDNTIGIGGLSDGAKLFVNGDIKLDADDYMYFGEASDFRQGWNSTDGLIDLEVGTADFFFTDWDKVIFDNNVDVAGNLSVSGTINANGQVPIIISEGLTDQSEVEAGNQVGAIEWYNNTFFFTDFKVRRTLVRGQDVRTENLTVENTVTETEIFNLAHGEDYLVKGKQEEIEIYGRVSSTVGAGSNELNLTLKYAGTPVVTYNLPEANRNDEHIYIFVLATVRSAGASGTMQIHSHTETETDGIVAHVDALADIDTTTQENLTITAEWSDASASNSITLLQGRALSIDDNQWT